MQAFFAQKWGSLTRPGGLGSRFRGSGGSIFNRRAFIESFAKTGYHVFEQGCVLDYRVAFAEDAALTFVLHVNGYDSGPREKLTTSNAPDKHNYAFAHAIKCHYNKPYPLHATPPAAPFAHLNPENGYILPQEAWRPMKMRRIILKNSQSPSDVVMLTAAVRDLHRGNPNQFETDVRTPCGHLWENNPFITPLKDDDETIETIQCEYPLIHRSNSAPLHYIHGFQQFLADRLNVKVEPTDFKGDVHISAQEKSWLSQVQEIVGEETPFWIIAAGGKLDYTIKWWDIHRFQKVVNHFRDRILFVQVGEKGHNHPELNGVLDLRGQTDLRQLVRLVYHSQGILCPVTLLMHLAAAVETKPGVPKNRACVVVAGGREPMQWEAYPHHQFIHTNGALRCCDHGGCWKARTVPLGDGDEKDKPENLCVDVVTKDLPKGKGAGAKRAVGKYPLPRCMDMITA